MKHLLLITLILPSFWALSQNMDEFEAVKPENPVPEDFTKSSTAKYKEDIKSNEDKGLDKDFFLKTRFFVDDMLIGGRVLFNDPITDYVNDIANYLLRDEDQLRSELRFYVLKSLSVNAFSTDQGIIFVTTGLVSQVENEAQLAYILAHEIAHYTEKHVRTEYVERSYINKGKGKYKDLGYDARIEQMSIYDKGQELEADQKGIDLYVNSDYTEDEIFGAFAVLLYSYLPFDDRQFDPNFLNSSFLDMSEGAFPDTIRPITKEEDYDDEGHTHPNIKKRMDAADEYLTTINAFGKKQYVIGEDKFKEARDFARFEEINLMLAERMYAATLYNIFLLHRDYPDNQFLDLAKVKSLYGLAKYKNAKRYFEVTQNPNKTEGESYKLHKFIRQADRDLVNILAYRTAYDMAEKYKSEKFKRYEVDMKKELAVNSNIEPEKLRDITYTEFLKTRDEKAAEFNIQDSIRRIDNSDLSKSEKIKLKRKLRKLEKELDVSNAQSAYYMFGLSDLVSEKGLVRDLEKLKKESEEEEVEFLSKEDRKRIKKKGRSCGLDKIVVVDPIVEDYALGFDQKLVKSEKRKEDVANSYKKNYRNLNLEREVIDSRQLGTNDAEGFYELGLIYEWMDEVLDHDDIDIIASTSDRMNHLEEKYGTTNFLFSGLFVYKQRKSFSTAHSILLATIYGAPLVPLDLLIVHNFMDLTAFCIDSETGDVIFQQSETINLKGTDTRLESYIFDILYQLNRQPAGK